MRACRSCGTQFPPTGRQVLCRKGCGRTWKGRTTSNAARTAARTEHRVEFIGCDGEGVTGADGIHRYVLLSVGDRSLFHPDGSELTHHEVFDFLYGHFQEHPDAAYVGFFLGYDFTQWLKSLRPDRAHSLFHKAGIAKRKRTASGGNKVPFPVYDGAWEYDLMAGKRFKLRRAAGPGVKNLNPWMYICDSGSFFQCSFLTAIDPVGWVEPVVTGEDYAVIYEGKSRRSTAVMDADMIRYNITENRILADLMNVYNTGLVAAGIRLKKSQWYGPGQAAQEWLNLIGAPLGADVRAAVPEDAMKAAQCTYYGGWFEILAHGHIPGTSYEYDINSAYPAVIATLPCLLHGTWTTGNGPAPDLPYVLEHVSVTGSDPYLGPLPFREPDGTILRPSCVSGWYWKHEIDAATAAGLIDTRTTDTWWAYAPCDCPPPLGAIAELYHRRLAIGKNTPAGKALKLVYNSCYGKMAQSVGEPKYANAIYASLITAGTRVRILQAIATHPSRSAAVLMVATDGIYFRTPHPALDIDSERLGAWDAGLKENLTLFMPGVYWDDKTRAKLAAGQAPSLKSRGISARDLAAVIGEIDRQFLEWSFDKPWPEVRIPVDFNMTTATQAITRGKWETAGLITTDGVKVIKSDPGNKRDPRTVHGTQYVRTLPYSAGSREESTPYDRKFGAGAEGALEGLEMSDDGDIAMILPEMLRSGRARP